MLVPLVRTDRTRLSGDRDCGFLQSPDELPDLVGSQWMMTPGSPAAKRTQVLRN